MKGLRIAIRERRALNCFVSGEYDTARKHFRAIEALRPDHPGINHNLGLVAMATGAYQEAERRFLADLRQYGDHYPRLRVLADLYYVWGKREKALEFYLRTTDDEPPSESEPLLRERILICESDHRYSQAQQATEHYKRGNELETGEQFDAALAEYEKAVALDPTHLPALNNAGAIRMNRRGELREAADLFAKGIAMERIDWLAANLEKANQALVEQES